MPDPRLLRWQDQMGTVAERWKAQYCHQERWGSTHYGPTYPVYERLKVLPPTATPADVKAIIGTDGWVEFWCNGCGEYASTAIQFGEEPDYESNTQTYCLPCFDALIAKLMELRTSVDAVARTPTNQHEPTTRVEESSPSFLTPGSTDKGN